MYTKIIDGRQVFSNCKTIQNNEGRWVSNPTPEMITAAGWSEYIPPAPVEPDPNEVRMNQIIDELQSLDYLTSKYVDGEDMTQYGDWQGRRRALRAEYNSLEDIIKGTASVEEATEEIHTE